jgi:hypothetical protein
MKKYLFVVLVMLVVIRSFAETSYIAVNDKLVSANDTGWVGARAISDWEIKNPDKKIVCVSPYLQTAMRGSCTILNGFWITWEKKEKAPETPSKK